MGLSRTCGTPREASPAATRAARCLPDAFPFRHPISKAKGQRGRESMSLNELRDAWRANDWGDAAMDTKKAAPRAPHPDRTR